MTLFDTGDYWRHPALWPTLGEDEVSLDEQARWVWPASFPINDDTYNADDGREYCDSGWTTRDMHRNWIWEGGQAQSVADYTAEVTAEWE